MKLYLSSISCCQTTESHAMKYASSDKSMTRAYNVILIFFIVLKCPLNFFV